MVHIENSKEVEIKFCVSQYCRNVTRALISNYFSDKDNGGGGRVGGGGCGGIQLVLIDLHCQGIICGARDTNNKHYTHAHTVNVHTVTHCYGMVTITLA